MSTALKKTRWECVNLVADGPAGEQGVSVSIHEFEHHHVLKVTTTETGDLRTTARYRRWRAFNHPLGKLKYRFDKKNTEKLRIWLSREQAPTPPTVP